MRTLACPHCGAPLPPRAFRVVVTCTYCATTVTFGDDDIVKAADYRRALADATRADAMGAFASRPRLEIGGFAYKLLGLVGQGESSDVFLATRARAVTERVLVKLLRDPRDRDLLEAEWSTLSALHEVDAGRAGSGSGDVGGSDELRRRLPQLVGRGVATVDGQPGPEGIVLRALSGFAHTFVEVMAVYSRGVEGPDAVWMWRRILELLAGLHQAGFVHGAVLPQHLVVHARDHGVMLVGWSCAAKISCRDPLRALSSVSRDCYAPSLVAGGRPTPASDITMSARCIARLLGGTADRVPKSVAEPVAALVEAYANGRGVTDDAWALRKRLGEAAREAYGPSRYHPFSMPA